MSDLSPLMKQVSEIFDKVAEPRSVRVLEIEQKIDNLRPDFFEAEEILQALEAALRARYDHALLDDISHYVTALGKALMRAEDEYTSE